MSVTTTTAIGASVAAFAPVVYAGTTTRNPYSGGVKLVQTITATSDNGGLSKLTVSSSTGFEINDTVQIAGATGDYISLNGFHNVTAVATGFMTVSGAYVTGTGTIGTVTRWNDSLRIRLEVYDSTPTIVATVFVPVLQDGSFSIDVSKTLQGAFSSIFIQTTGDVSTIPFSNSYTIRIFETWQAYDYSTYSEEDESEAQATIAHRTTVYDAGEYITGSTMLTGNFFAKGTALIHFLCEYSTDVHVITTAYPSAVAVDHLIESGQSNDHLAAVVSIPSTCDYVIVTIAYDNGTQLVTIKDTLTIYNVKSCKATVLYYLNRLGGYEGFMFTSYEDAQVVERVDKYKAKTWKERTLIGFEFPYGALQSVRDLITSPEVYDESGVLVEVLEDSMTYYNEIVNPIVKIKYEETLIQ